MSSIWSDTFERHQALVKSCETLSDFIAAIPVNDATRAYLLKYSGAPNDYNDRWFRTWKKHGYGSRPLAFPEAETVADLFETAKLVDIAIGAGKFRDEGIRLAGTQGYAFIGGRSAKQTENIVPFEWVGFKHCIRALPKSPDKLFCHALKGSGKTLATYVKPKAALSDWLMGSTIGTINRELEFSMSVSFEAVEREGGKTLIIARFECGQEWIALLDSDKFREDIRALIPADQMELVNEAQRRRANAHACVDSEGNIDRKRAEELGVTVFLEG